MKKIIAFSNQKGGVGKTTSALNVGAAIALRGHKVLLFDLDPQANLSKSLGLGSPEVTIYDVLTKGVPIREAVYKVRNNLLVVPCTKKFSNIELEAATNPKALFALKKAIANVKSQCDYVILDCPPSLGLITTSAMIAANEVYTPLEAQEFSIDGLSEVQKTIVDVQEDLNPGISLSGVFFTRHNPRKLISQDMEHIVNEKYPNMLMNTHIRECVQLKESPSIRKDVFEYDAESNGAEDYMNLAEEILK